MRGASGNGSRGRLHGGRYAAIAAAFALAVDTTAVHAQDAAVRSDWQDLPPSAAASPFALDSASAIDCMTVAIAYEAGHQPIEGQEAVGEVILNRLHSPRFPKSVCGVVFAGAERRTGCQFTFTCDGSLRRRLSGQTLETARSVAISVLTGAVPDRVAGATHYHADYVLPYWAASGIRVGKIGAHIFYRMPGTGGVPVPGEGMTADEASAVILAKAAMRPGRALPPRSMVGPATRPMFAPWGLSPTNAASR